MDGVRKLLYGLKLQKVRNVQVGKREKFIKVECIIKKGGVCMKPHQKEVLEMAKKGLDKLFDQLEVVEDVPRFGGRGKWDKDGLKELLEAVKTKLEEIGEGKAIRVPFEVVREFYKGEFKGRSTDGRKDPEIRRVLKPIAKKMGLSVTVTKDGDVYAVLGE